MLCLYVCTDWDNKEQQCHGLSAEGKYCFLSMQIEEKKGISNNVKEFWHYANIMLVVWSCVIMQETSHSRWLFI